MIKTGDLLRSSNNLWFFFCFSLGIILTKIFNEFFLCFSLCLVSLFLVLLFSSQRKLFYSNLCVGISFILLASAWAISFSLVKNNSFNLGEGVYQVEVISLPQDRSSYSSAKAYLNGIRSEKVFLRDYTRKMQYLNVYQVKATLSRIKFQEHKYLTLFVKEQTDLVLLPTPVLNFMRMKTINYFLNKFSLYLTKETSRFFAAVFLGVRGMLGQEKQAFQNAGIAHLLAISGLHVGVVVLVCTFVFRIFYLPLPVSFNLSVALVWIYAFLTGMETSLQRALLMFSVFSLAFLFKRKVSSFDSLGLAGLIILIFNPFAIFEISFQLSFLSVIALIFAFRIKNKGRPVVLKYFLEIFISSISVSIFITPIVSYHFGKIYIASIFYNLIFIPFFMLLMVLNFIFVIFSIIPFLAQAQGALLSYLFHLFNTLVNKLGAVPWGFLNFKFTLYLIFIYYVLLVIGLLMAISLFDKTDAL